MLAGRQPKYRKTRYHEMLYAQFGPEHWQCVTSEDLSQVGPIYPTKAELLRNLDRYCAQYGCEGAAEIAWPNVELEEAQREKLTEIAQEIYELGIAHENNSAWIRDIGKQAGKEEWAQRQIQLAALVQRLFNVVEKPGLEMV